MTHETVIIDDNALSLLHHTLGLRPGHRVPYRNHFVAGHGHHAQPALEALEAAGLMARARTPKFCDPADVVFICTEAGKEYAIDKLPPEPKRTKYDEYLNADCCDSFADFLGINKPKYETRGSWKHYEYRMYRRARKDCDSWIYGDWAQTKKAAKASYKLALAKYRGKES